MRVYDPIVRADFRERVRARRDARGECWPPAIREPWQAHLRALAGPALLGVRVSLDSLAAILADGRFKTRHELGGQPGKSPPRTPAQESVVWNVSEHATRELPIYGYLATLDDVSCASARISLHQAYGSARVLLADDLRSRSTVFFADSRWSITHEDGAPAPVDQPDELCWLPDRGAPTNRCSVDDGVFDEVVELQVIGGIDIADITAVVFDEPPPGSIDQVLRARKIECDVNPFPEMSSVQRATFRPDRLTRE